MKNFTIQLKGKLLRVFFKKFNDRIVKCLLVVENHENGNIDKYFYEAISKVNIAAGDIFDFEEGSRVALKKVVEKLTLDLIKFKEGYEKILDSYYSCETALINKYRSEFIDKE